jgi:ABC-2 type transport system ATP-binding protein
MMDQPVISLQNTTKSYGAFTLGPASLDIEPGYVVAIIGPNGSGKTTLFRMLMNLVTPDSGDIEIFGLRHSHHEVEIKQRTGYMPETPIGYEEMSLGALGEFVSYWYPTWNQAAYDRLLQESEVSHATKFSELSKGLQRRISFALARSTDADLLLLDEPTANVDPFARRAMMDELSQYMQSGDRTVLMATHVMEEVRRLADYIVLVQNGAFHGFYEKDMLFEQWRSIWIDREPQEIVPGVVHIERGTPTRLITNSPVETEQALSWNGVQIVRRGPLDLEEILSYLMRERTSAQGKLSHLSG